MIKNMKKYLVLGLLTSLLIQPIHATGTVTKIVAVGVIGSFAAIIAKLMIKETKIQRVELRNTETDEIVKVLSLKDLKSINHQIKTVLDWNIEDLIEYLENQTPEKRVYNNRRIGNPFMYDGVECYLYLPPISEQIKSEPNHKNRHPKKGCLKKDGNHKGPQKKVRFAV